MTDKKTLPVEEDIAPPKPRTIKLIPVPGVYIPGVPAMPQDVSPERAKELLAYTPAAFKKA